VPRTPVGMVLERVDVITAALPDTKGAESRRIRKMSSGEEPARSATLVMPFS